ncbi:MAG: UbiA family prenyltransferase [Candidatus Zixiibacteriota bacterium]|nr:MAG: UbiA family prenyltransferase [candidate division Zixibacteria bacterium]
MTARVYSISSFRFWGAYWTTMRPYLLFVSGAAGLSGLVFTEQLSMMRLLLGFLPLFFSYGLGQSLTDCFQTDTDALSSPYRPLVRGLISKKQVLFVSLCGLTASVALLCYLNPIVLIPGFAAVLGLLTYTKFKRTWWGGPPWNSWIVALLPIVGRLVDGPGTQARLFGLYEPFSLSFFFAVLVVFCAYANFVIIGYFKDISADSQTGYKTFPVVFGWKAAAIYSDITAGITATLATCTVVFSGCATVWSAFILTVAVAVNLYGQMDIHRVRDECKAHGPISHVLRAFVLYCLAIVTTMKFDWIVAGVPFYLLFELSMYLRPEESQV